MKTTNLEETIEKQFRLSVGIEKDSGLEAAAGSHQHSYAIRLITIKDKTNYLEILRGQHLRMISKGTQIYKKRLSELKNLFDLSGNPLHFDYPFQGLWDARYIRRDDTYILLDNCKLWRKKDSDQSDPVLILDFPGIGAGLAAKFFGYSESQHCIVCSTNKPERFIIFDLAKNRVRLVFDLSKNRFLVLRDRKVFGDDHQLQVASLFFKGALEITKLSYSLRKKQQTHVFDISEELVRTREFSSEIVITRQNRFILMCLSSRSVVTRFIVLELNDFQPPLRRAEVRVQERSIPSLDRLMPAGSIGSLTLTFGLCCRPIIRDQYWYLLAFDSETGQIQFVKNNSGWAEVNLGDYGIDKVDIGQGGDGFFLDRSGRMGQIQFKVSE